jgi:glycosyltransferase involved in cell wall biosynthesis
VAARSVPRVSVVASTFNRAGRLRRLLDALRSQTIDSDDFEVVIVDDASTDDTPAVLEAEVERGGLNLEVIRRESGAGPATAREHGWRAAAADLIAFTDDDCEPTPDWLERALAAAENAPGAFIQGRTEPNPFDADPVGAFTRTIDIRALDPNFHTCNIVYPRRLLEGIGGFDTVSFDRSPGGEDSDLAWRAIAAGAEPVFAPEVLVHHAVNELGPIGKLRVAARWTTPMKTYARHPALRKSVFTHGIFWKPDHFRLTLALVGLALPRRLWPVRLILAAPYVRSARARSLEVDRGATLAPYFLLHDLIELGAVARAGVRYRTLML